MRKETYTFIGGIVIGILVGALIGGYTISGLMGSVIYKLSIAKPVCNTMGQVITK